MNQGDDHDYPLNSLKIFLGHGDEAATEATAILGLEPFIQQELNKLRGILGGQFEHYSIAKIWQWRADAKSIVGGQEKVINPNLDIADISIFVFRSRVGAVTWDELNRCREIIDQNEGRIVIALFPDNPPSADILNNEVGALAWADLKSKESELTRSWNEEESNSVTPVSRYKDCDDLKSIVFDRICKAIETLLNSGSPVRTVPTQKLNKEIAFAEFNKVYDETHYLDKPCPRATIDDLDWELVKAYASERDVEIANLSKKEVVDKLGFFHSHANSFNYITRTAVIAFAKEPSQFIPQACIKFRIDRNPPNYDYFEISKPLAILARETHTKILNELEYTTRDSTSFEREKVYEIPQEVIRELVSNALVHRSYELESDVIVRIDHSKIEVLSPGGTASSSYENMLNSGSSFPSPRNPTLKKVAENLLIFEGTGKGFKVFWEYASKRGGESLVFESEETPEKATFTKVVLNRPAIPGKTESLTYSSHTARHSVSSQSINSSHKVFISYSHDSDEHLDFVRGIADRLRQDGISCLIDQYVNGFPPEGWLRWMESQVEAADFVLLICTKTYLQRYRGHETGGEKGISFEGVVISQYFYDNFHQNTKFIPVIPDGGSFEYVPVALKEFSTYSLPSEYEIVYRILTSQGAYSLPELGKARGIPLRRIYSDDLPTVEGELFGREAELALLDQALSDSDINIVQFVAPGGTGKTKLVRIWLDHNHDNIDGLIAWSFYSQGSGEYKQSSATPFFMQALKCLGSDKSISDFNTEEEKGDYIADLLREKRCLLVLDGLESLQQVGRGMKGELKDRAIRKLLRNLAGDHSSFCIITTRIPVHELQGRRHIVHHNLQSLTSEDGVALLRSFGVFGREADMLAAVEEYGHHALALHLLGNTLSTYLDGDVRKRDTLAELMGDYDDVERHAFKVMQTYQHWLEGTPELKLLYLLSLFDHPVEEEVLQILWKAQIPELTEGVSKKAWLVARRDLSKKFRMISAHEGRKDLFDCHPLIREYFGRQLQETQAGVWQQAHAVLYNYYKELPNEIWGKYLPDTLEEMQPLLRAATHGCKARLYQQVVDEVYIPRIRRGEDGYITNVLGAFIDDLGVLANFFSTIWTTPMASLEKTMQAGVLHWASFGLRSVGRINEALGPMQSSLEIRKKTKDWGNAATQASNIAELYLNIGDVGLAKINAQIGIDYADQSGSMFQRISKQTAYADILHQSGDIDLSLSLFKEAEQLQHEFQPEHPLLYGFSGIRYSDLLLTLHETSEVIERSQQALEMAKVSGWLLDIALNQLMCGKAFFQKKEFDLATKKIQEAVGGLRAAGVYDYLIRGLVVQSELYRITGTFSNAFSKLQEAYEVAEPSGMRLHLTDYHLEMARLILAVEADPTQYPEATPDREQRILPFADQEEPGILTLECHIAEAARLIEETGYHRRDAELAELQKQVGTTT